MISSEESTQTNENVLSLGVTSKNHQKSLQNKEDVFAFLRPVEEKPPQFQPFFSKNGLSQDILSVTYAEPDICLEVFYALQNMLLPQIEKHPDGSLKNAWKILLGTTVSKGILCPPEKLLGERRIGELEKSLSNESGEKRVFQSLDTVVTLISSFKQKIIDSPHHIDQKEEIIASLTLSQEFYMRFRNKVKKLVQATAINHSIELQNEFDALIEPKAMMMSDILTHHWAYRIPRSQAQKVLSLDQHGTPTKNDSEDPANHRVFALPEVGEPLVYFKANGFPSIEPHKEFMLYSLYRHLKIPVPETALVILTNVFEENANSFFAAQASEAVSGESTLKAYRDPEVVFKNEAYVPQVIGAFLTNPSDGSPQNFKYCPIYQTLVSIDNDYVFDPELSGKDGRTVSVKSTLYLLSQMDNHPIPESVQTYWTTLDPHLTALAWLKDLSRKNVEYKLLFARFAFQHTRCIYQNLHPQSSAPSLEICLSTKVEADNDGSFLPEILVSKSLLDNIIEKLQKIESTLTNNRSASPQMLFRRVSPLLAEYYRKLRLEFSNDPEMAMRAFSRAKKNEIPYYCLDSLLNNEEIRSLTNSLNIPIEDLKKRNPEELFVFVKSTLSSEQTPLDSFIRRHRERRMKGLLDLQEVSKELGMLIQEELMHSRSIKDIADFLYDLSKTEQSSTLIKEINTVLSNLPYPELEWLLMLDKFFIRADLKDFADGSISVRGAFMKKRTLPLTKAEKSYLFDEKGWIRKNSSLTGRSRVTCFPNKESQFYLKQHPEWPGYEYASSLFMRLLGVAHLPYQDLIIVNPKSKTESYPVLLTQKVDGHLVLRVWGNPEMFSNLDPLHTGLLIISAMLLNPEDGKEDNFILSSNGKYLIPIDSDHSFLPSTFQKAGSFWNAFTVNTALQTKTLLFCLDEMNKPVPNEVRKHLLSTDFDELLINWMTELVRIENKYSNLADDEQQRIRFFESGTVLRIPFYKQFIDSLHWKAHKIQDILKASSGATPFDLLKAVEPFAAKCYQASFAPEKTLGDRFKAATKKLYTKTGADGSRMSVLNTRTMIEIIDVSDKEISDDPMYQKMGPTDALGRLNQLIREHSKKLAAEKELLCELNDNNKDMKWGRLFGKPVLEIALKEFFANPKEAFVLKGSKLITSSTLVAFLQQSPNKGANIRFLSLPQSPLLTSEAIKALAEGCPNIEYLDVSYCVKLKEIITARGEWPLLARLEARGCPILKVLACSSPLKILRIGSSKKIEIFIQQPYPETMIVNMNTEAIKFDFLFKKGHGFEIKSQDEVISEEDLVSYGPGKFEKYLQDLQIQIGKDRMFSAKDLGIFIESIDKSNHSIDSGGIKQITDLNLITLKKLNLSNCSGPERISLKGLVNADLKNLTYLNLSGNKFLEKISILSDGLWPSLETVDLQEIEVSDDEVIRLLLDAKWLKLKEIIFSEWRSVKRDFEGNYLSSIEKLNLRSTTLQQDRIEFIVNQLDLPQLKHLDISFSKIGDEGLEVLASGKWSLLEHLNLHNTSITAEGVRLMVDRSHWPNLKILHVSRNQIRNKGLEVLVCGKWPLLEHLDLYSTNIIAKGVRLMIDKSHWPNLKILDVSSNQIGNEGLGVLVSEKWPLLEHLDLCYTSTTAEGVRLMIDRSHWPNLKILNLYGNKIGDEGLEAFASGKWPLLENLNLHDTSITAEGVRLMIDRSHWPNLKILDVSANQIGDEGLEVLVSEKWPLLEGLNLSDTKITAQGIRLMIDRSHWSNLKILDVSVNQIGDEGLKVIVSGKWPLLEHLNLHNTSITAKGVRLMIDRSHWPNLKILHVSRNQIWNKGLEVLVSGKWPHLKNFDMY